ncbi:hypothetical protein HK097_003534 [Rhizophlyctis rosea]|uniref:Uncharacterized protein n=1 Tax=Rhizophlyctis rosea TaxID=64517 RepID=A0AAD5SEU4_9FUNG|nr:hypothetical protein HK097_003534 [Rhizophlyctis rosea]
MGAFDELVAYPGIRDVPKNQRDTFIRTQRQQIQSSVRQSLDSLKSTFPNEFSNIKGIYDPDDLVEPLDEIREGLASQEKINQKSVLYPPGAAEFILFTYETTPSSSAAFGLPTISSATHSKPYGEDELNEEYGFYLNVDSTSKSFGKVAIDTLKGSGKFLPVADTFEEFLEKFVEFMTDDFAGAGSDRKAAVEDWYLRFADPE